MLDVSIDIVWQTCVCEGTLISERSLALGRYSLSEEALAELIANDMPTGRRCGVDGRTQMICDNGFWDVDKDAPACPDNQKCVNCRFTAHSTVRLELGNGVAPVDQERRWCDTGCVL